MDAVKFSFVVVNFNMRPLILQLIDNIRREMASAGNYEILVIDNSTDSTSRMQDQDQARDSHLRIKLLDENRGLVDALNLVLPTAAGEKIMIMHPDIELAEGCIRTLSEFLDNNPCAGVVSPDLYYPNGQENKIRTRSPSSKTELRRLLNIVSYILLRRKMGQDEILWDRSGDVQVETVMSVCMMFRKAALAAVLPINPKLVFYYANDYLSHRIRKLGWTCHYARAARAIHFERYTPVELYSNTGVMAYKRSAVAANPRMRSDFFAFLSSCYPFGSRAVIRSVALAEDLIQLLSSLRRPRKNRGQIALLWKSILADLAH